MGKEPQLPMTGTRGARWKATDDIWRRFEEAYGEPFDSKLRAKIEAAIADYFDWVGAPSNRDFADKLAKARKLALELRKVVDSFGEPKMWIGQYWDIYFPPKKERSADGQAAYDSQALYDWATKQPPPRNRRRSFSEMVHIIYSVLDDTTRWASSSHAREQSQVTTWKELIAELDRAFRSSGLTAGGSKDPHRPLRPFVRFVKELQGLFAEDYWRPSNDGALSERIYEITKNKGKKQKTGGFRSRQKKDKPSNTPRKRV